MEFAWKMAQRKGADVLYAGPVDLYSVLIFRIASSAWDRPGFASRIAKPIVHLLGRCFNGGRFSQQQRISSIFPPKYTSCCIPSHNL